MAWISSSPPLRLMRLIKCSENSSGSSPPVFTVTRAFGSKVRSVLSATISSDCTMPFIGIFSAVLISLADCILSAVITLPPMVITGGLKTVLRHKSRMELYLSRPELFSPVNTVKGKRKARALKFPCFLRGSRI